LQKHKIILEQIVLDAATHTNDCLNKMYEEGIVDRNRTEEHYQFLEACTRQAMMYNYSIVGKLQKMCLAYLHREVRNYEHSK
jgi:hypothetical protein